MEANDRAHELQAPDVISQTIRFNGSIHPIYIGFTDQKVPISLKKGRRSTGTESIIHPVILAGLVFGWIHVQLKALA